MLNKILRIFLCVTVMATIICSPLIAMYFIENNSIVLDEVHVPQNIGELYSEYDHNMWEDVLEDVEFKDIFTNKRK